MSARVTSSPVVVALLMHITSTCDIADAIASRGHLMSSTVANAIYKAWLRAPLQAPIELLERALRRLAEEVGESDAWRTRAPHKGFRFRHGWAGGRHMYAQRSAQERWRESVTGAFRSGGSWICASRAATGGEPCARGAIDREAFLALLCTRALAYPSIGCQEFA